MLTRLVFSFVLGLFLYRPRPTISEGTPPGLPPGADPEGPPIDGPDAPPPIWSPKKPTRPELPQFPELGKRPKRPEHRHPTPRVPPTPPPGHEGDWPPASERPLPPNGPPGHDGEWPPRGVQQNLLDRIRSAIEGILSRRDDDFVRYMSASTAAEDGAHEIAADGATEQA